MNAINFLLLYFRGREALAITMPWYTLSIEIGWGGRCPFLSRKLVGTLCIKIQNLQVHPIKHFIMRPWFQKIGKLGVHQGRNLPLSLAFLARLKRSLKSRKTENPILQLRHDHYLVNLALFVVCCFSPTVNETYFLVRNLAVTWGSISLPMLLH